MTTKEKLTALIRSGFDAVKYRIPVESDDNGIAVRNMFIEIDEKITCYSVENWEPKVIFSLPIEAIESAATTVVLNVLTGLVSRAIENTWRELDVAA